MIDSRQGQEIFILSKTSLGLTQPRIQWVPGFFFSRGTASGGVNLTTHIHLVPGVRIGGVIHMFPLLCPRDVDTDNIVSLYCVQATLLTGVNAP